MVAIEAVDAESMLFAATQSFPFHCRSTVRYGMDGETNLSTPVPLQQSPRRLLDDDRRGIHPHPSQHVFRGS